MAKNISYYDDGRKKNLKHKIIYIWTKKLIN